MILQMPSSALLGMKGRHQGVKSVFSLATDNNGYNG